MAGKGVDRKGKYKESKSVPNELADNLAAFTLPESLPCSEVEFPVLIRKASTSKWSEIVKESENNLREIEEYVANKSDPVIKAPFLKTECDYIKREVFVHLIPALEDTLNKATTWEALRIQKCFFNGIDHIAQVLWNNNPRYPCRKLMDLHLFNMAWVRDHLKKKLDLKLMTSTKNMIITCIQNTRRPYYPKSWLWPEEYAATLIQKSVRQYFVQREEEVQEMRDFWRKVEAEQNFPQIDTNPYLAMKFASLQTFHKKP